MSLQGIERYGQSRSHHRGYQEQTRKNTELLVTVKKEKIQNKAVLNLRRRLHHRVCPNEETITTRIKINGRRKRTQKWNQDLGKIRAGTPTAVTPSGRSRTTAEPAPTVTSDPIRTCWITEAPMPIQLEQPTFTKPARRAPGQM